jgi:hypothetical protein
MLTGDQIDQADRDGNQACVCTALPPATEG